MDEDTGDDDVYAQQLKEVFNSCDLQSKGYLNRNELIDLSHKLQLGDQVPDLLKEILGDEFSDGKVTFEKFKDGFVNILANAIDCLEDVTDDQSDWSEIGDRRSIVNTPDILRNDKINGGSPTHTQRKTSTPNVTSKKPISFQNGIHSAHSSDSGHGEGDSDEAVQLRRIWDDLAVGESGYLNLLQLSIVCEHIGMEGIAGDELELLFSELDKNGDGFVSFQEFLEGLFLNKRPLSSRSAKTITPVAVQELSIEAVSAEPLLMETPETNDKRDLVTPTNGEVDQLQHPPLKKKRSTPRENIGQDTQPTDLFSSLDPFNTGKVECRDLVSYLKKNNLQELEHLVKDAKKDENDFVKTRDLVLQLERIIYEKENPITRSVFLTYKKEISRLREEIEKSSNELSIMKSKSNILDEQNRTLTKESEEQLKKTQEENERRLKEQAKTFAEKLSKCEQELKQERDSMLKEHQIENEGLRERLEEIKSEDSKTKGKLKEASMEISKLEENLSNTISELTDERNKYARFQQVLESEKGLKQKIDELEGQLTSLAGLRTKQKDRIRQLEDSNKILQYQNEEHESQIEELQLKLANIPNENASTSEIRRNGSYLSEYLKPNIIRRDEFGNSMDEEETSNKEMEDLKSKIFEQEKTIESLRRDLQTVNQMVEENDSSSSSRHQVEINRLTDKFAGEITDLQLTMSEERKQLTENFAKEKSSLIEHYENKIKEVTRNFDNEKQNMINGHHHEKKRWEQGKNGEKSIKRWENLFQIEREEIELKYRGEITKLEEKIVILETEMAEMELRFLNEKAELEQQFRIERSELMQNASTVSREYDSSQKYIDSLKDELTKRQASTLQQMQDQHHKDKQRFKERMENELNKLKSKHSKELSDERKNNQNQMNVQSTAAATEKSRYLRELQELKDQLFRANASSDRDNALKDKVFNDAKAEVLSLNKKIEQKTRKVKSLEESLQQMESQIFELDSERKELDEQVQHWKTVANGYSEKAREEKKNMTSKSIRSDTLVTELYCENAELMKQVANAETNQAKAEKQVRQLTDQKRALQRVISKLCNAYGITNLS